MLYTFISGVAYALNDYLCSYTLHNMSFAAYYYTTYTAIYLHIPSTLSKRPSWVLLLAAII